MVENVFKKRYAECLIARTDEGKAVGMALVSVRGRRKAHRLVLLHLFHMAGCPWLMGECIFDNHD